MYSKVFTCSVSSHPRQRELVGTECLEMCCTASCHRITSATCNSETETAVSCMLKSLPPSSFTVLCISDRRLVVAYTVHTAGYVLAATLCLLAMHTMFVLCSEVVFLQILIAAEDFILCLLEADCRMIIIIIPYNAVDLRTVLLRISVWTRSTKKLFIFLVLPGVDSSTLHREMRSNPLPYSNADVFLKARISTRRYCICPPSSTVITRV